LAYIATGLCGFVAYIATRLCEEKKRDRLLLTGDPKELGVCYCLRHPFDVGHRYYLVHVCVGWVLFTNRLGKMNGMIHEVLANL
jgi:hypothetical protein